MLGWDVGTWEFTSPRILALGYKSNTKLKLRTGGSIGVIPRTACHTLDEKDGIYFDLAAKDGKHSVRLPIKHRYRSPVVFEFHSAGKRAAVAYALIWLQHFIDNEETPIDIPIWTTKNGDRLTQNYITERNWKAKEVSGLEDLEEVGRLQFRGRFKAGTDESHEKFVSDNDTRETYETWEACRAEGVRGRHVEPEVPERLQTLHEESLREGRDVLKQQDPKEREKWLAKDGQDWSGAFGENPKAYTDPNGRKIAEPGRDRAPHDPVNPRPQDNPNAGNDDDEDDDDYDDDSDSDLGINDANSAPKQSMDTTRSGTNGSIMSNGTDADGSITNKKTEKRKNRGLMQWKPVRNVAFAKDETKFAARRLKNKLTGGLGGREPSVETETGQ